MKFQPGTTLELDSKRPSHNQIMIVAGRAAIFAGLVLATIPLLQREDALPQLTPHAILESPVVFISIMVAAPVLLWSGYVFLQLARPWVHGRGGRVNHIISVAGLIAAILATGWLALIGLAYLFYPG
jgi:lysylphosphatidylglycerol synthetase-like protein (DUF2156 family)